jgi:hypothetical protein
MLIYCSRAIQFFIRMKSYDKEFSSIVLCIKFAKKVPFTTNLTIYFVAEQLFVVGLTIKTVVKLAYNMLIDMNINSFA